MCVVASSDLVKEPTETEGNSSKNAPPEHRLIAVFPSAHGVYDVNTVSWCPRKGMKDVFATTGDDGVTRIWKVMPDDAGP